MGRSGGEGLYEQEGQEKGEEAQGDFGDWGAGGAAWGAEAQPVNEFSKEYILGEAAKRGVFNVSQEPGKESRSLDYMNVRLQSPSDIRRASTRPGSLAEVKNGMSFDKDGPVQGGLYCEKIFGMSRTYDRRIQSGYTELAWPCSHVWFTAGGRCNGAAKMLEKDLARVLNIRMYKKDVYLGQWSAASVWRLRDQYGEDEPQVPCVGSLVSAEAPSLLLSQKAWAEAEPQLSEDKLPLQRRTSRLASLMRSASKRYAPWEAQRLSAAFSKVLALTSKQRGERSEDGDGDEGESGLDASEAAREAIRIGMSLPDTVMDLYEEAQSCERRAAKRAEDGFWQANMLQGSEFDRSTLRQRLPDFVAKIANALSEKGLGAEDAKEFLSLGATGSSRAGSSPEVSPLRAAARSDIYRLWQALVVPDFEGDLPERLTELMESMEGLLESADIVRVQFATKKLEARFSAALDVVLQAFASGEGGAGQDTSTSGAPSRLCHEPYDVLWYDTALPVATWHDEDVDRVRDRLPFKVYRKHQKEKRRRASAAVPEMAQEEEEEEEVSASSSSRGVASAAGAAEVQGAGGVLTMPRRRRGAKKEATYHRQGAGRADMRWHLPLQDSARPGRGGGLHPVHVGQDVAPNVGREIMRYCFVRPRPAGSLPHVPSCMEAEGSLLFGSGGAALRTMSCFIEPKSSMLNLARECATLDKVLRIRSFLAMSERCGFHVEESRGNTISMNSELLSVVDEKCERKGRMQAMLSKRQFPEWMFFVELPIIPPDLRTRSASDPTAFADDLNVFYKNVVDGSKQLKVVLQGRGSGGLIRYFKQSIQTNCDNMIDNGRIGLPVMRGGGEPMESVAGRLKGKFGRMRSNMLGKRVDYSARTVIVCDPSLRMDECALPFEVAHGLYRGFWMYEMAKDFPETEDMPVNDRLDYFDDLPFETQWDLVERGMKDRFVLLNRAPTLHRLGMQAFRPRLVEGQALRIHPLVTAPFNADFDGDTMTIHLGLGREAQEELKTLMVPSSNLSSPASGEPVIGPTQDMVLGIYYLTVAPPDMTQQLWTCNSLEDFECAAELCHTRELPHDAPVRVPVEVVRQIGEFVGEDDRSLLGKSEGESILTTAGRALFFVVTHRGNKAFGRHIETDLVSALDKAQSIGGWSTGGFEEDFGEERLLRNLENAPLVEA